MARDWTHTRLQKKTLQKLEEIREILWRAHERGARSLALDTRDRCSIDQVIGILADHYLDHRERSRKSRTRSNKQPPESEALASESTTVEGD